VKTIFLVKPWLQSSLLYQYDSTLILPKGGCEAVYDTPENRILLALTPDSVLPALGCSYAIYPKNDMPEGLKDSADEAYHILVTKNLGFCGDFLGIS
jgi:hypothetical protein